MSDRIRITITHRLGVHSCQKCVCHNWFRELCLSDRWWQNVAVNDACVPFWRHEHRPITMAIATTAHQTYNTNGGNTNLWAKLPVRPNVTCRYADNCAASINSRCRHGNWVSSVSFSLIEDTKLSISPRKKPRLKR